MLGYVEDTTNESIPGRLLEDRVEGEEVAEMKEVYVVKLLTCFGADGRRRLALIEREPG